MSFIAGLITGAIISGVFVRVAYNAHISIANEVISSEWAEEWVKRNCADECEIRF